MKVGGASTINDLAPRTWQKFVEETKLGPNFVRRHVKELTDASKAQAPDTAKAIAKPGLDKAALSRFAKVVQD